MECGECRPDNGRCPPKDFSSDYAVYPPPPPCDVNPAPCKECKEDDLDRLARRNKVMEQWFWAWFWRDLAGPLMLVFFMFLCLWICLVYDVRYLLVVFVICFALTPCLPVMFWPMLASLLLLVMHGWTLTHDDLYVGWGHHQHEDWE